VTRGRTVAAFCVAAAAFVLPAAGLAAQQPGLGRMWTFENAPLAYLKQEYGFAPTQEWLDMLRLSALRFGDGCSASFVSPKGLILTNHHCARDRIAEISNEDKDLVANGFYARALADELPLPGLTVQQLAAMSDVTAAMNDGITADDNDETSAAKRSNNEQAILAKAAEDHPGLDAQIVTLFQGAQYQLYLYRNYDDVRLVCAPHLQAAYFGGDPDNFTYPRYCLDFAFVRAYVDGKPADTSKHWFRWNAAGPKENDLVFVVGNPGSTDRLLTKAQMEYHRDAELPLQLAQFEAQLEVAAQWAKQQPARARELREFVFQISNAQKAYRGEYEGLLEPSLLKEKAAAEADFRARIDADPAWKAKFGTLFDRLAENAKRMTELVPKLRFHSSGDSAHVTIAELVLEAVDPARDERSRAFILSQLEEATPDATLAAISSKLFADQIRDAQKWLGDKDPFVVAALAGGDADAAADRIAKSRILDRDFRNALIAKGAAAVHASDDPAIQLAVLLRGLSKDYASAMSALESEQQALGAEVGRALFAVYGTMVSPDATFTLRFSDGVVRGYPMNGTVAPWRTVFGGMFARSVEFAGKHPFDLPELLTARRDRIDLTTPVNLVSTNDITGGNSGSPLVDRDLRLIGLIFDGNIESLPNRFLYRSDRARTVSVHAGGILEALRKIYDADALADELTNSR
jgi:hypothetical protein